MTFNRQKYREQYIQSHRQEKKEYDRKYYQDHKIERKIVHKKWYDNNRLEQKQRALDYYYNNKQRRKRYVNFKRKTDLNFWFAHNLRSRINSAIKTNQKVGSAVQDLGCTIPELKEHLEKQFQSGMNWNNRGKWHIDHIIPLDSFDLTDRKQFLKAVNYKNLQPLWETDNLSKGKKI
ncbi:MAG: hypothetical protein R3321_08575 [Nitrososphaeraceae archaeon]|nr:hypothetical protein [Nitrososphaeraceae archaeon]